MSLAWKTTRLPARPNCFAARVRKRRQRSKLFRPPLLQPSSVPRKVCIRQEISTLPVLAHHSQTAFVSLGRGSNKEVSRRRPSSADGITSADLLDANSSTGLRIHDGRVPKGYMKSMNTRSVWIEIVLLATATAVALALLLATLGAAAEV